MFLNKENIIAHRGQWSKYGENYKNSKKAIFEALDFGFGIETDVRLFNKNLVISHDPILNSDSKLLSLSELFDFYKQQRCKGYLALNIKEDGLGRIIKELLFKFKIDNYFLFDASAPECVLLRKLSLNIFARESEYEDARLFGELNPKGVWLDGFNDNFQYIEKINLLRNFFKFIAIVSPELHGRSFNDLWGQIKNFELNNDKVCLLEKVMICTDYPIEFYNFLLSE